MAGVLGIVEPSSIGSEAGSNTFHFRFHFMLPQTNLSPPTQSSHTRVGEHADGGGVAVEVARGAGDGGGTHDGLLAVEKPKL